MPDDRPDTEAQRRGRALSDVTFRRLLTRTVVLPLALLAVLSAVFIGLTLQLKRLNQRLDHTDRVLAQAHLLQRRFIDAETGLRGFLLTGSDDFLQPYGAAQDTLPQLFAQLRDQVAADPEQGARVAELATRWERWTELAAHRIVERRGGAAISLQESIDGKAAMDAIRSRVQEFVDVEERHRAQRSQDADEAAAVALAASVIIALAMGSFIALVGRRQLLALSSRYEAVLDAQRRDNAALRRQEWVNGGRAQLVDDVRGELAPGEVDARVLAALVRHLDAAVGVLYVVDDDGSLRRAADFACAAGAEGPPERLAAGSSWPGQVARDCRVVALDDVPEGHVRVATGTGSSRPRHLLVAPLTAASRPVGVVELGFLAPPVDGARAYLEVVAEAAGHAMRSARYRLHLQRLLEESQRQAEELQAQQEELRVANEELAEQTQTLQRSQAQLEEQREELQVTNDHLNDQARALEEQRDVLERAQRQLVEKADELERANRYKSEFLANMSHELRTPLNSALILAKLLADNKDGNLGPDQVRYAQTIYGAGNDLLQLINDILDLSRIEAGRMELQPEQVRLRRVADELARTFQPMAQQKGLRFAVQLEPGAPEAIETDAQRLQQILRNLLSNAIKFTERGEVVLRVGPSGAERVAFAVHDSGIGIAADKLELIFEAFRQVDGSTHRQYGGTGLGLTISRDLARRLGGDVHVESTPGQGSTFSLVLPRRLDPALLQRAAAPPPAAPPRPRPAAGGDGARRAPEPLIDVAPAPVAAPRPPPEDDRDALQAGARILLVIEDDTRFARIVYDLAHEQGYRCLLATTAAEGLELARRYRPTAVVLDVNLPDGSGLYVLEQLKRSGETRHVPVHVVSVVDYTQRALELGAIGYAIKPVQREQLAEAFRKLQQKSHPGPARVLVVEDAEVQRESLRRLLQGEAVEITGVATAGEALSQLRAGTFDCMVLDLGLPDMSGFELLESMSADPAFSFPPVIVYTGRALDPDEEMRLRRYSSSVVIKGARSPERLLDEVTLFIHRVESSLPREQQRMLRDARNREAVFEGRRVLLAEDDVRNVYALTSVLEGKGAHIQIARNGQEALDVLERSWRDGAPAVDLVLMDVMMPVLDGLAAMRAIRSRPEGVRLPIIALTAKAMPEDRERCLEAGANDYVAKPLDVDKLLSLIRVWMPK